MRPGAVLSGRLIEITVKGREGVVALDGGGEALLSPLPAGVTQGARVKVEIVRAALPEHGRAKRARAALAAEDARECAGPDLLARIAACTSRPSLAGFTSFFLVRAAPESIGCSCPTALSRLFVIFIDPEILHPGWPGDRRVPPVMVMNPPVRVWFPTELELFLMELLRVPIVLAVVSPYGSGGR